MYILGTSNLETIELDPLVLENFTISGCSKLRSLAITHSSVEVSHSFYLIFLLNKEVLTRRFRFYFVFCVVVVLSTFGLSSFYRRLVSRRFINIWFVVVWFVVVIYTFSLSSFYRCGIVRRLVVVFYLCGSDSDKEDRFDSSKISNYVVNIYIEELKLQIF